MLGALLDERRIKRMSEVAASLSGDAYRPEEMLTDLSAAIWSELDGNAPTIDLYRRNLQRAHVELLAQRLDSNDAGSDMAALARTELTRLRERTRAGLDGADPMTTAHLASTAARIDLALEKVRVEQAEQEANGRSLQAAETWCFPGHDE